MAVNVQGYKTDVVVLLMKTAMVFVSKEASFSPLKKDNTLIISCRLEIKTLPRKSGTLFR